MEQECASHWNQNQGPCGSHSHRLSEPSHTSLHVSLTLEAGGLVFQLSLLLDSFVLIYQNRCICICVYVCIYTHTHTHMCVCGWVVRLERNSFINALPGWAHPKPPLRNTDGQKLFYPTLPYCCQNTLVGQGMAQ